MSQGALWGFLIRDSNKDFNKEWQRGLSSILIRILLMILRRILIATAARTVSIFIRMLIGTNEDCPKERCEASS